jgi:hypothetical protein
MDVVRHEAPGEEPVATAVEMKKSILNQGRNVGTTEPAGTRSSVEPLVNEANAIVLRKQCFDD